ncbi:MAG: CBS domain-containing protein [Gammaproteobacteria bacterium]|jgi:CBS domain-containing protein
MKVQDLMTTSVESIAPTKSLKQAARKMAQLNVGFLPIVEDGQLLGTITDRDITCYAVAIGRNPDETEVQRCMTRDVITCFEDQDINEAAHLMEERHIRRLPILHRDNTLAGIMTVDDLARGSHDLAGAVLEAATPIH